MVYLLLIIALFPFAAQTAAGTTATEISRKDVENILAAHITRNFFLGMAQSIHPFAKSGPLSVTGDNKAFLESSPILARTVGLFVTSTTHQLSEMFAKAGNAQLRSFAAAKNPLTAWKTFHDLRFAVKQDLEKLYSKDTSEAARKAVEEKGEIFNNNSLDLLLLSSVDFPSALHWIINNEPLSEVITRDCPKHCSTSSVQKKNSFLPAGCSSIPASHLSHNYSISGVMLTPMMQYCWKPSEESRFCQHKSIFTPAYSLSTYAHGISLEAVCIWALSDDKKKAAPLSMAVNELPSKGEASAPNLASQEVFAQQCQQSNVVFGSYPKPGKLPSMINAETMYVLITKNLLQQTIGKAMDSQTTFFSHFAMLSTDEHLAFSLKNDILLVSCDQPFCSFEPTPILELPKHTPTLRDQLYAQTLFLLRNEDHRKSIISAQRGFLSPADIRHCVRKDSPLAQQTDPKIQAFLSDLNDKSFASFFSGNPSALPKSNSGQKRSFFNIPFISALAALTEGAKSGTLSCTCDTSSDICPIHTSSKRATLLPCIEGAPDFSETASLFDLCASELEKHVARASSNNKPFSFLLHTNDVTIPSLNTLKEGNHTYFLVTVPSKKPLFARAATQVLCQLHASFVQAF